MNFWVFAAIPITCWDSVGSFDESFGELFEFVVESDDFGGANKREIGGVEEKYAPLADNVRIADVNELTLMIGSGLERKKLGSDDRHKFKSF